MTDTTQGSDFDPDLFMQQNVDQPMATEFEVVDPGDYTAMIDDFDSKAVAKQNFTYKNGPKTGEQGSMIKFNCPFSIQDEALKVKMAREKIVVFMECILDVDAATGKLDFSKDKNIALGRIRDAVNQNVAGEWGIPMLRNTGPVMIRIIHDNYKASDGTPRTRAKVSRVSKIR